MRQHVQAAGRELQARQALGAARAALERKVVPPLVHQLRHRTHHDCLGYTPGPLEDHKALLVGRWGGQGQALHAARAALKCDVAAPPDQQLRRPAKSVAVVPISGS